MAQDEFDYTTKMVNQDLSNFSAWHNRSKVILKMLDEKQATDEERKEMLNSGKLFLASATEQHADCARQNSRRFTELCSTHTISHCGSIIRT